MDNSSEFIFASNNFTIITVKKEVNVANSENMNVDDGAKGSSNDHKFIMVTDLQV